MHLASDYIHPYKDASGSLSRCRVRIYVPDDMRDNFMGICSQLTDDSNTSVTNIAEYLVAEVIREHKLPASLVWVEHYPEHEGDRRVLPSAGL